jgi:hypothetical protein
VETGKAQEDIHRHPISSSSVYSKHQFPLMNWLYLWKRGQELILDICWLGLMWRLEVPMSSLASLIEQDLEA